MRETVTRSLMHKEFQLSVKIWKCGRVCAFVCARACVYPSVSLAVYVYEHTNSTWLEFLFYALCIFIRVTDRGLNRYLIGCKCVISLNYSR